MSRVLEKTMSLNEPLASAYKTICEFSTFDALTAVPHPDNLRFQFGIERQALRRLGIGLANFFADAENPSLQYAVHVVRCHFWQELGLTQAPKLENDVPQFLRKSDYRVQPYTDPVELAAQLSAVAAPDPSTFCIVGTKLALLQKLLNFSDKSIQFLALAYAASSTHSQTHDLSGSLATAINHVQVADSNHRDRAIALLLDAPKADVLAIFGPPSILVALGFMQPQDYSKPLNLRQVLMLKSEFITILETPYRSHEALLADILTPEYDPDLLDSDAVCIGDLYQTLPRCIAECYERVLRGQPLQSRHVLSLTAWFTGGIFLPAETCIALDGRLTFEAIRDAIKRAALVCCQANKPFGDNDVLKALYAALA
jgi:hypothetical protein